MQFTSEDLDLLVNTVDSLIVITDSGGVVCDMNRTCARLTDFRESDVVGENFAEVFLIPAERETVHKQLQRVGPDMRRVTFESSLLTRSGRRLRINWSCVHLTSSNPLAPNLALTGTDVTQYNAALERLEQQQREIDTLQQQLAETRQKLKSAQPIIVERRKNGRYEYAHSQLVAPVRNQANRKALVFRRVECKDVSANGFSFVSNTKPDYTELVVMLGKGDYIIRLVAKVAHVSRTTIDGKYKFLVGCRYVERHQSNN